MSRTINSFFTKTLSRFEDISNINEEILSQYCEEAEEALSDSNMLDEYLRTSSVKRKRRQIQDLLDKYDIDENISKNILDDITTLLIPPGTKGVCRGNKFNTIIKKFIQDLHLPTETYDIMFEYSHPEFPTNERPDFVIYNKKTNKIINGMNQLTLWGGGHQTNRATKYILNNIHNTENSKLLCVVCNKIQLKGKNKEYQIFKTGFESKTLCYLNGLKDIIFQYFHLSLD
jgi:alpha-amylase/alpha-mannosidase (GH57 family)